MKILLLGEYSNLHWTLAEGLRTLGHHVVVASDGDGFKNFQRDIDLKRNSSGIIDTLSALGSVYKNLDNLKNYDIVQLINPCFTTLNIHINRQLYKFLKKHNNKVFLGAFGDDSYWLKACLDKSTFRYSEFYIGDKKNYFTENEKLIAKWGEGTERQKLNAEIADNCDGIIACLYEYYAAYKPFYSNKLKYIPLPVNLDKVKKIELESEEVIHFFVGINKVRSKFKGTDKLYNTLVQIRNKYPESVIIKTMKSVAYEEYMNAIRNSQVVLDQLYSYSPAMNGLLSLAMGKVLVSGGEPEMYELISEYENRPIINVFPTEEDIYLKLDNLVQKKDDIPLIAYKSRQFVEKHHDHVEVARQYLEFWTS